MAHRARIWTSLALATLVAGVAAGTASAGSLPGLIAHNHDGALWTVEPNNPDSLIPVGANLNYPSWSPDGTKLAVTSVDNPPISASVVIIDRDGNELDRPVENITNLYAVDWSPDGTKVAYSCYDQPNLETELCVVDLETGVAEQLSSSDDAIGAGEPNTRISWSPDGGSIAWGAEIEYECPSGGCAKTEIVITDAVTGSTTAFTDHYALDPDWSPDGKEIVYFDPHSDGGEPTGIVVAPAPGQPGGEREVVPLTHVSESPHGHATPGWSPDGEAIVFAGSSPLADPVNGNSDLFTVDASGGSITNTTETSGHDGVPSWGPPGLSARSRAHPSPTSSKEPKLATSSAGARATTRSPGSTVTTASSAVPATTRSSGETARTRSSVRQARTRSREAPTRTPSRAGTTPTS